MPAKKRSEADILQEQKAVLRRMSELCTSNRVPAQLLKLPYKRNTDMPAFVTAPAYTDDSRSLGTLVLDELMATVKRVREEQEYTPVAWKTNLPLPAPW